MKPTHFLGQNKNFGNQVENTTLFDTNERQSNLGLITPMAELNIKESFPKVIFSRYIFLCW